MTYTTEIVRSLKGAPLSVLVVLSLEETAVTKEWLERNTGYTDKPMAQALAYLQEHGYIVKTPQGWKLSGPEWQLPLGYDRLTAPVDPAPLQADVPLDDAAGITSGRNNSDSGSDVVVVLRESSLKDESIKNNNNSAQPSRKNSDSGRRGPATRGQARHIADVTAALLRNPRGAGAPGLDVPADDDPFPADLRAAINRLVERGHLSRRRAELAVARSPWDAAKILDQLDIWLAYLASPDGASLDRGKFPWLVAARLENGEECPNDARAEPAPAGKYDGFLPYVTDSPIGDDNP